MPVAVYSASAMFRRLSKCHSRIAAFLRFLNDENNLGHGGLLLLYEIVLRYVLARADTLAQELKRIARAA